MSSEETYSYFWLLMVVYDFIGSYCYLREMSTQSVDDTIRRNCIDLIGLKN